MTGLEEQQQRKHEEEEMMRARHALAAEMMGQKEEIQYNRNEEGFIICPICPQLFGFRSSFRNHLEKHTPDPSRPLKCDFCPYYSNNKIGISNHARCHKDGHGITISVPIGVKGEDVGLLTLKAEGGGQPSEVVASPSMPGVPNNPNKFECSKCPYRTDRAQKLLVHMDYHGKSAKNYIPCTYCDFHASRHGQMTRHLKMHEDAAMGLFLMYYEWENMDELPENNEIETDQDVNLKLQSEQHAAELYDGDESGPAVYPCDMCPYKCDRPDNLTRHMEGHKPSPDKPFKCFACPFYASTMQGMARHAKIHEGPEEFDEENEEQEELEETQEIPGALIRKNYNCDQCPQKLNSLNALTYHMEGHGGDPSRMMKCSMCSYRAKNKFSLGQHFRCHKEETDKNTPAKKVKQEEDIKPPPKEPVVLPLPKETTPTVPAKSAPSKSGKIYACSQCPATFPYGGSLWKHQSKHEPSPDRPFRCDYCTFSCSLVKSLKMHEKVHQPSPDVETALDGDIIEDDMEVSTLIYIVRLECNECLDDNLNILGRSKIQEPFTL